MRRALRAAATALPPSRCLLPPRFALPTLPRRRHAIADVAVSRWVHPIHHRAAAVALCTVATLRAAATAADAAAATVPPPCCAACFVDPGNSGEAEGRQRH